MDGHNCIHEERWGKVLATLEHFTRKVCKHIDDGEKQGGFRDRVLILEETVSALKRSYWKTALTCGIIGGLLGKISPDIFNLLVRLCFAGAE